MNVSSHSNPAFRVEIGNTLLCINDLAIKIKQELEEINSMVKSEGQLYAAINIVNITLGKTAQDLQIDVDEIFKCTENDTEQSTEFSVFTPELIAERIKTLVQLN